MCIFSNTSIYRLNHERYETGPIWYRILRRGFLRGLQHLVDNVRVVAEEIFDVFTKYLSLANCPHQLLLTRTTVRFSILPSSARCSVVSIQAWICLTQQGTMIRDEVHIRLLLCIR